MMKNVTGPDEFTVRVNWGRASGPQLRRIPTCADGVRPTVWKVADSVVDARAAFDNAPRLLVAVTSLVSAFNEEV